MPPQLISLLQAISQDRQDLKLASFDAAQIHWAAANGLGPILAHAIEADDQAKTSPMWPLLRGAALTARVLTGEQIDAMIEIIDGCAGRMAPLTLLKGISVCDQYYPAPHLRPMRDIDFLIETDDSATVNSLLLKLGYHQHSETSVEFYQTHHHDIPWFHPEKKVWIEVHRGLFPPQSNPGREKLFSLGNVKAQLQPSEFHGRSVNRLSNEMQIVYIASHWASDFIVAGGMVAFLDMIFLLKNYGQQVNWQQILEWVDGSITTIHLYLLLSYIDKHGLVVIAPSVLDSLRCKQRALNHLNLSIMHKLIDRYFAAGMDFGWILNERNLSIVWKSLVSSGAHYQNLFSVPRNLLMPKTLRARFGL